MWVLPGPLRQRVPLSCLTIVPLSMEPGVWSPSAHTPRVHTHLGHALGIPVSQDSFPDDCEPPSELGRFLPEVFPAGSGHTADSPKRGQAGYLRGLWISGGLAKCPAWDDGKMSTLEARGLFLSMSPFSRMNSLKN